MMTRFLILLAAAAALSSHAEAQSQRQFETPRTIQPPRPLEIRQPEAQEDGADEEEASPARTVAPVRLGPLVTLQPQARWHFSTAAITTTNEGRTVPGDQLFLSPVTGLSDFHLTFGGRSDHKIRRMAVLAEDRFVRFSFADQDSNDRFEGRARFVVFSAGQQHQVTARGSGSFEIPMEAGPANHTAVLTGFDFQRETGTDANVRTVSLWIDEDDSGNPVIRATLLDDMGADFRGLAEATFAGMAAAIIPTGSEIVSSHAIAVDGLARLTGASGGYRPYAVTVQYGWVPNNVILRDGAAAGGSDRHFERGNNARVLTGFYFHFGNEDHHLAEIGVTPATRNGIRYRDSDFDDPVSWELQYVELRDDMRD